MGNVSIGIDLTLSNIWKTWYLFRNGDDFIVIDKSFEKVAQHKSKIIAFLQNELCLEINPKNDIIVKTKWGIRFLGVWIYPKGRKLQERSWRRALDRVNYKNASSYSGLIKQHENEKRIKLFNWEMLRKLNIYD